MALETLAVTPQSLREEIRKLKGMGCRFVTMSCSQTGPESFDLLYHFDLDLELTHLRMAVAKDQVVPSASPVYLAAFLIENEIQDQFGLRFSDLAIDYEGKLYLDPEAGRAPFCTMSVNKSVHASENAAAPGGEEA